MSHQSTPRNELKDKKQLPSIVLNQASKYESIIDKPNYLPNKTLYRQSNSRTVLQPLKKPDI